MPVFFHFFHYTHCSHSIVHLPLYTSRKTQSSLAYLSVIILSIILWFLCYRLSLQESLKGPTMVLKELFFKPYPIPVLKPHTFLVYPYVTKSFSLCLFHSQLFILNFLLSLSQLLKIHLIILYFLYHWALVLGYYNYPFTSCLHHSLFWSSQIKRIYIWTKAVQYILLMVSKSIWLYTFHCLLSILVVSRTSCAILIIGWMSTTILVVLFEPLAVFTMMVTSPVISLSFQEFSI